MFGGGWVMIQPEVAVVHVQEDKTVSSSELLGKISSIASVEV